ncbi:hypothetical protein D1007_52298 [Hordeum vulgare]|nr:hypothetical protein D1007_52298 [Hordeum vulgare]
MVAAGPRLPCLYVGSPGSGAAAPLARHARLAAVRVVDLASRPCGRPDPVVIDARWRLLRWQVRVIWRLPSSPVRRAGQPGRAALPWVAGSVQEAPLVAGIYFG